MYSTQEKVSQNLSGLQFLLSRPDTRAMAPHSEQLDACGSTPAFHVCYSVMRDNLTVICISLRVGVRSFGTTEGVEYRTADIVGRGTTFEMALFDLSAQLIKMLGDNEVVDTDNIPMIEERGPDARPEDSHESVRTDEPASPVDAGGASDDPRRSGYAQ